MLLLLLFLLDENPVLAKGRDGYLPESNENTLARKPSQIHAVGFLVDPISGRIQQCVTEACLFRFC
jgi:hypothetical protein